MGGLWVDQPKTSEDLMCWVDHQFSTLGIRLELNANAFACGNLVLCAVL